VVTDEQVRKLMKEFQKSGEVGVAAMKARMDRKTARRYIQSGRLPSQMKPQRTWRTRADPFAEHWEEVVALLEAAPELEAKALFEHFAHKLGFDESQLRTFQRRVREWRAQHGPEKEVSFPQTHVAGEALQTDFTWCTELGVTIGGEAFPHLLCHVVLPYSNWSAARVCRSESMAALRNGVQHAVFKLGSVPEWHQTDNSTAATHNLGSGKREFNKEYADFVTHLGMKARTIAVGQSEQNGDVESLNGALKRRLHQHLLLRRSSDFAAVEDYERWVEGVMDAANRLRERRLKEDLAAMRPLVARRLVDYTEERTRVSAWSTIRVQHNSYSLPSRLIGEQVTVRVYEDRLEVWYGGVLQEQMERLLGRNGQAINYRHVIFWMLRKPGAFARYRYREAMFPSLAFRRAYDALVQGLGDRKADIEYLRVLNLAATTLEDDVDLALALLIESRTLPTLGAIRELTEAKARREPPHTLAPFEPDLGSYDTLVGGLR
jgi:transposase